MSLMGKAHLNITWVVDREDEAEWDRIWVSHAEWMQGHPREGDAALLAYTISKGPQLANPLDPGSEPTGRIVYVLDEYYESAAGVTRHWEDATENWAADLNAVVELSKKADVTTLHDGSVVQALW